MPPTEECALGAANRARIVNLEKSVDEIRACMVKLTNHYAKRLSPTTVLLLVALSNLCTGLIIYVLTH